MLWEWKLKNRGRCVCVCVSVGVCVCVFDWPGLLSCACLCCSEAVVVAGSATCGVSTVVRGVGPAACGCVRQLAVGPFTNAVGPFTARKRGVMRWPRAEGEASLVFSHEVVTDRPNIGVIDVSSIPHTFILSLPLSLSPSSNPTHR